MTYVTAIMTSFTGSDSDVTLKARGRAITTAVDSAEITRRKFMKELNINNIKIGTEELQQEEGGARNVSTIEITLTPSPLKKQLERKRNTKIESVPTQDIELTSVEGVGTKRAEKLKAYNIHSVQDLAKVDPKELSEKLQISEKRVSKWVDGAKDILNK